jgi:polyisoprenoid-binding protein YceI
MIRLLTCLFLVLPGLSAAAAWRIDPSTTVEATVAWKGQTVTVHFPDLSGDVDFDAERPEAAKARITAPAGAATTGVAVVDGLLRGRDYLDASGHPEITFELEKLTRTSKSTADVSGRLTLRGVTRPLALKATVFAYGPAKDDPAVREAGFDLSGEVDRTEFGSTGGLPDVSATMPLRIHLLMTSGK